MKSLVATYNQFIYRAASGEVTMSKAYQTSTWSGLLIESERPKIEIEFIKA